MSSYNYYDFLLKKQIKYDVAVDLSGIDVKSDASLLEQDSDSGEYSEVNLSETVDENINYVYSACNLAENNVFSYTPLNDDGTEKTDGNGDPVVLYRTIGENVAEVDLIDFDASDNPTSIDLYGTSVSIEPRHIRFENNMEPIIEKGIFAALGLVSNNKMNTDNGDDVSTGDTIDLKMDLGISDKKYRGFISKKSFYKKINTLSEVLQQNNIELTYDEFNKSLDDSETDINESGVTTSDNFYTARLAGVSFINKKYSDNGMTQYTVDDNSPFNLSVKEVFKAFFTSADDLYNDFMDELRQLLTAINSNTLINSFVDTSSISLEKQKVNAADLVSTYAYNSNTGANELVVDVDLTSSIPYAKYVYNSTTSNGVTTNTFVLDSDNNKMYEYEFVLPDEDINEIVDALPSIKEEVNSAASALLGSAFLGAGFSAAIIASANSSINTAKNSLNELNKIIQKIRWYQHYTNESVFLNRVFIKNDDDDDTSKYPISDSAFTYDKRMCRLLVPVYMGTKKEKHKKKGLFGRTRTYYTRIDLGVRWVEINFSDVGVYKKYRKNESPLGISIDTNIQISSLSATNGTAYASLTDSIPDEIMSKDPMPTNIVFTVENSSKSSCNGTFDGDITDSLNIVFTLNDSVSFSNIVNGGTITNILISFDATKSSDSSRNVTMKYSMPHLPFDSELRQQAFTEYGAFDQSEYATKSRNGDYSVDMAGNIVDDTVVPGWEIFHESSKGISDLRSGIDIYPKVEFLMKILIGEFGNSRVHLIETMRSFDDQEVLQTGGDMSSFLSWHNFGLAVKIRITKDDLTTAIEDGSDDALKLMDIAEAFINNVSDGNIGTPLNVIWCGQLVTGPDLFVWEFLPIGVSHKDALKFRDTIYNQEDPVISNGYVNVTEAGYIVDDTTDITTPCVKRGSKAITDGITLNSNVWVNPKRIKNYSIPNNFVLKDIREFLMLVDGKMKANGTSLMGRRLVSEWKAGNPKSYNQLIMFYSLIGNYSAVRGLLSGDYIEHFDSIVSKYYEKDPIKFVQLYLGDEYENIKIYIDDMPDGSYISLYDGKLTTPLLEARSTEPEGNGNTFGQKQLDFNNVEFGQYESGVFIGEDDSVSMITKTDSAVISGYDDNGNPSSDDAYILHTLIADQLIEEFRTIRDNFNDLDIKFMYDSFYNSPNYESFDLLENEFGVIETQDLLTFSQLRDMYTRLNINSKKTTGDGTVLGAGANLEDMSHDGTDESVYEKLVSNSQLVGIRKAKLTKENTVIEKLQNNGTIENAVRKLKNKKMPTVDEIL